MPDLFNKFDSDLVGALWLMVNFSDDLSDNLRPLFRVFLFFNRQLSNIIWFFILYFGVECSIESYQNIVHIDIKLFGRS